MSLQIRLLWRSVRCHAAPRPCRRILAMTSSTRSVVYQRSSSVQLPQFRHTEYNRSISFFSSVATPIDHATVISTSFPSILETEKDEIMKEIRIATHENIKEMLESSDPRLKNTYEKTMKRMEQHGRIPRKKSRISSPQRNNETLRPVTSTSLEDLLNAPMEQEFGLPSTAATTSSSLMDLLDQPAENGAPSHDGEMSMSSANASLLELLDQPIEIGTDHAQPPATTTASSLDDLLQEHSMDPYAPSDLGSLLEEEYSTETTFSSIQNDDATRGTPRASSSLMDLLERDEEDDMVFPSTASAESPVAPHYENTFSATEADDQVGETSNSSESLMDLLMDDSIFATGDERKETFSSTDDGSSSSPTANSLMDLLDSDIENAPNDNSDNNEWLLTNNESMFNSDNSNADPQSYNNVMSRGIALLASMSDQQWRLVDGEDDNTAKDDNMSADVVVEEELLVLDEEFDGEASVYEGHVLEGLVDDAEAGNLEESNPFMLKLESMLKEVLSNNMSLTTEEYNLILLQLASTASYANDDAIGMLMQVYSHMTPSERDGYTHAIMIPALIKRGQAPIEASQIILDMNDRDYVFDNTEALTQAMMCLERCKRLQQAEQLIQTIMANQEERITIPVHAILPLIRMYKAAQKMDETMDMIDDYLKEAGVGVHMHDLCSTVISWPRWNAHGERVDIRTLQIFMFNKLKRFERENNSRAKPPDRLWKSLIIELAKSAPHEGKATETQLIQEILWLMLKRNPSYWPDGALLKYGLEVAAKHDDSKLAVELLERLLAKPPPRMDGIHYDTGAEVDILETPAQPLIPPQAFLLAMQTCVAARDSSSVSKLLTLVDHPDVDVPEPVHYQSMNQAVRVFAIDSNWVEARATLTAMKDRDLVPSDEAFGAVIHSLAVEHRPDEALELFSDMESGSFGDVRPGALSFNAKMLALMQMKSWQKVIDLQQEISSAGLPPSSVAFHGVILASMKLGAESSVLEAIENATKSNVHLNQSCFEQSLKCLFPDLAAEQPSIPKIRIHLRELVDSASNTTLAKAYLNLSRSLRVAEVEEEREKSRAVSQEDIDSRRQKAWDKAHTSLVELYRAAR